MKDFVKRYAPKALIRPVGTLRRTVSESLHIASDSVRFRKYYSKSAQVADFEQLSARLVFHAHSLEKGLSHTDVRLQFGSTALTKLAAVMRQYTSLGYSREAPAYQNALSVLAAYKKLHLQRHESSEHLSEIFGELMNDVDTTESEVGGVTEVTRSSKSKNREKNFRDLFNGRTSVREYAPDPVDTALIEEAIAITMKSPSICNRQGYRVRVLSDKEIIAKALAIQGGLTGYPTPPVLLVITTDLRTFVAPTERNQTYVDGGVFAMSLLLALEYVGLAACPLNTMFSRSSEIAARELLNVEHENFIMFISVGNFRSAVLEPKSFRYGPEKIII